MKKIVCIALLGLLSAASSYAQQNVNIRGMVTAFDGKVIDVKTRDGGDVKIALPDTVNVNATKAFTMADIKPGMVMGVTTVKRADIKPGETVFVSARAGEAGTFTAVRVQVSKDGVKPTQ